MHQHHHLNPPSPSIRRSTTTTPHLFICSPSSTSTNSTGGCAAPAPTTAAPSRSASALASHPHFSMSSASSKQQAGVYWYSWCVVCQVSNTKHQQKEEDCTLEKKVDEWVCVLAIDQPPLPLWMGVDQPRITLIMGVDHPWVTLKKGVNCRQPNYSIVNRCWPHWPSNYTVENGLQPPKDTENWCWHPTTHTKNGCQEPLHYTLLLILVRLL
jgi:hypothetical protein